MNSHKHAMRTVRGGARAWVLGLLALGLIGGGAYYFLSQPPPSSEPTGARSAPQGAMTEEERLEYVKSYVTVEGLSIGPDTKPDSEESVPGLLRVSGEVVNEGDRRVPRVILGVFPKDEGGEVISAHFEDVVKHGSGLAPEKRRTFKFTIPDKKDFGGAFDHELR